MELIDKHCNILDEFSKLFDEDDGDGDNHNNDDDNTNQEYVAMLAAMGFQLNGY